MRTRQHTDGREQTTFKVNIPKFVETIAAEFESLSEMSDDGLSNSGLDYFFFQACAHRVVDLPFDVPFLAVEPLPVADMVDDLYAVSIGVGVPHIHVVGRGLVIQCCEDDWDVMFSCEDADEIAEAILTDITEEANRLLPAARALRVALSVGNCRGDLGNAESFREALASSHRRRRLSGPVPPRPEPRPA